MSTIEKLYAILAICCLLAIAALLIAVPSTRTLARLVPLALLATLVNAGLLFLVFKDIFSRTFSPPSRRYLWLVAVFLFVPSILFYLPMHGFKRRGPGPDDQTT